MIWGWRGKAIACSWYHSRVSESAVQPTVAIIISLPSAAVAAAASSHQHGLPPPNVTSEHTLQTLRDVVSLRGPLPKELLQNHMRPCTSTSAPSGTPPSPPTASAPAPAPAPVIRLQAYWLPGTRRCSMTLRQPSAGSPHTHPSSSSACCFSLWLCTPAHCGCHVCIVPTCDVTQPSTRKGHLS